MSLAYQAVQWNRQKRRYDWTLAVWIAAFLGGFAIVTKALFPAVTDEILVLRACGTAALALLHLILAIGPLCRLDPRFLPLLYNRRHAGVALAILALAHAVLVLATYHAAGDVSVWLSLVRGSRWTPSIAGVPFQLFGLVALLILLLMAATSHDFWLAQLTAPVWKSLHQLVYVAYGLLVLHVAFGVLQAESHPLPAIATGLGLVLLTALHLAAARREGRRDATSGRRVADGFVDVLGLDELVEGRGRTVMLAGERVALFRYDGLIAALSNVCQHQNGPLGEGRIRDGCVTCPWHGYQYDPATGAAPAPFVERVPTFNVRIAGGRILVHPQPNPPGHRAEPARVPGTTQPVPA